MRHSFVRTPLPRVLAVAMLLLHAACSDRSPTVQPQPEPQPQADAGISGVSSANAIVCARNAAGSAWCTRADAGGSFRITRAEALPVTGTSMGTGDLPVAGVFTVYTVDCPAGGKTVDRVGAQRNGGSWLDVRCTPDGCMAAPTGLLAWYRFDEAAGDTAADHANAAPASPLRLHGPTHTAGRVLGALDMSSPNAFAQGTADKNLGTGDFTISLWIRMAGGQYFTLLDKRDAHPIRGYHMVISGGEPLIQLANADGEHGGWYNYHSNMGSGMADGRWHHLAVTVERASTTGLRWYVDGLPAGEVADPTHRQGSLASSAPLRIGAHSWYSDGGWDGAVDELQIHDRALSAAEVLTLATRSYCR
ncbi:MAG TPA: LamG domain-containing protein [Longimicrobium sp.]|nr:LamG domain-containing protein [Longimicrobium sp.]